MSNLSASLKPFIDILDNTLIPNFCQRQTNTFFPSDFKRSSIKVANSDALDFKRAWTAGLIKHIGSGKYRAAKGGNEGFFSSGPKAVVPRTFSLSIEPIITIGMLARLHFDYGWPAHLIGAQSSDWAFDAITHMTDESENEHIACEVKTTAKQVDTLITLMKVFAEQPEITIEGLKAVEENAFKKAFALRKRRAPLFWAAGPNRYEKVFKMSYQESGVFHFEPTTISDLAYPGR